MILERDAGRVQGSGMGYRTRKEEKGKRKMVLQLTKNWCGFFNNSIRTLLLYCYYLISDMLMLAPKDRFFLFLFLLQIIKYNHEKVASLVHIGHIRNKNKAKITINLFICIQLHFYISKAFLIFILFFFKYFFFFFST